MVTVVDYILGHRTNYKEPHVLEAKHVLLLRTADAIKRHFLITPEIVDGEIWGEFTKPNLPYFNDPPPKGCPEPWSGHHPHAGQHRHGDAIAEATVLTKTAGQALLHHAAA